MPASWQRSPRSWPMCWSSYNLATVAVLIVTWSSSLPCPAQSDASDQIPAKTTARHLQSACRISRAGCRTHCSRGRLPPARARRRWGLSASKLTRCMLPFASGTCLSGAGPA